MIKPYYEKGIVKLFNADCLEILKQLLDNSVDSIITDPPYNLSSIKKRFSKTSISDDNKTGKNAKDRSTPHARLSRGFMGKAWDNDIAFKVEVWEQCLRVAKPGCILMAMGGSRTSHRLACAIEDAGWEIRDEIKYFYDNSQQFENFIESLNPEQLGAYLELHYPSSELAWVYGQGISLGKNISKGIDAAKKAKREVIETIRKTHISTSKTNEGWVRESHSDEDGNVKRTMDITVPATELAKLFDGWYSRIKPAHENIIVAQKKLEGTYANNAEVWGVAGFDVDRNRVGTEERINSAGQLGTKGIYGKLERNDSYTVAKGRFPANITHDDSEEVNKEFDKVGVSVSSGGGGATKFGSHNRSNQYTIQYDRTVGMRDSGTPARYYQVCPPDTEEEQARFLYTAKASEKDKGKGNSHPTSKPLSLMRFLVRLTKTPTGGIVLDPFCGSGTTLEAAKLEEREGAIGIELEEEYCETTVKRLQGRENVAPEKDIKLEDKKTGVMAAIDKLLYE